MNRIKQLRRYKGWTQEQFANYLEMSLSYVKKVELGHIIPSVRALQKMAVLLDAKTIDELLNQAS